MALNIFKCNCLTPLHSKELMALVSGKHKDEGCCLSCRGPWNGTDLWFFDLWPDGHSLKLNEHRNGSCWLRLPLSFCRYRVILLSYQVQKTSTYFNASVFVLGVATTSTLVLSNYY